MERGFGECEGMTRDERSELKVVTPEIEDIWNYNTNVDVYNMETMKDFCFRVYEFLDEITEKYKDKNILLVTHGGVSVPIKFYFTKKPLEEFIERDSIKGLKNCEVIKYEV